MAKLRIRTAEEFLAALRRIPFAVALASESLPRDGTDAGYRLWHELRDLVHKAIEDGNWHAVRELLELYDAVERVGPRSAMFEASYVAFLEDVKLPDDRRALQEFWRHVSPLFAAAIKADRGLR